MTKELVDEISEANASLFATTARLLDAADDVKRDRQRLLRLLREAAASRGFRFQTAAELDTEQRKARRGQGVASDA